MDWSTKRRTFFILVALIILSIIGGLIYAAKFYQAPSCVDKKQNQSEEGIDCGGPCSIICTNQIIKPAVLWSRAFEGGKGSYNAVAYIENPNIGLGVREAIYSFKLYDENNLYITERQGKTYIRPGEQFAVFEPRIPTGERKAKRAFFEFIYYSDWIKIDEQKPNISVSNQSPETGPTPRVTATLRNKNNVDVQNIEVISLIYDNEDNAVAASASSVDLLPADSSVNVVFTWPVAFLFSPARVEIIPRVNPFLAPIQ